MRWLFLSVSLIFFLSASSTFSQQKKSNEHFNKERSVIKDLYKIDFSRDDAQKVFVGYNGHQRKVRCSFLILNNLAKAAQTINEREAFDCINTYLSSTRSSANGYLQQSIERTDNSTAFEPAG